MLLKEQSFDTRILMTKHIIKTSVLAFCMLIGVKTVVAQDLMANQAPVDRQLKAVDSVSLQRAIKKEMTQMVSDLYPNWTDDHVNAYKDVAKPSVFKIDLTGFSMPTPSRKITSRFGYRAAFRRDHYGLDIKVYTGDTIFAAFSGKARIVAYDRGGFGYYIVLRHPNGLETVYGHLSKQLITENEEVRSGEPIGLGGNTGHSFGSHLHFETRLLGEPINPELMFDFPNQDVTADSYIYRHDLSESESRRLAEVKNKEEKSLKTKNVVQNEQNVNESSLSYYKVKRGDTLYSIAQRNSISVNDLCSLNRLSKRSKLRLGQILKCK